MDEVRRLHGVGVFGFDREGRFGDQCLQDADMGPIAGIECLVGEQEHAIAQMGVEISGQVFRVGDDEGVLAEDVL